MTAEQTIEHCQRKIDLLGENALVVLLMPGKWGNRSYRKIAGIKGEIVGKEAGNMLMVVFPAVQLKAALEKEMAK